MPRSFDRSYHHQITVFDSIHRAAARAHARPRLQRLPGAIEALLAQRQQAGPAAHQVRAGVWDDAQRARSRIECNVEDPDSQMIEEYLKVGCFRKGS